MPPTAAVILTLLSPVRLGQWRMDHPTVPPIAGVQPHHRLVGNALGIAHAWDAVPSHQENRAGLSYSLEREFTVRIGPILQRCRRMCLRGVSST